jgi:hypothetical protein
MVVSASGAGSYYRKNLDSKQWHFCKKCSRWPTSNYKVSYTKPAEEELCPECKSLTQTGNGK